MSRYFENGIWNLKAMIEDGRSMNLDDAKALGNKDIGTPNTEKTNIFAVVDKKTGMVLKATWTFNRARQNKAPNTMIVHIPSERVVMPTEIRAIKNIIEHGNSLVVSITREVSALDLELGDQVEIVLRRVKD